MEIQDTNAVTWKCIDEERPEEPDDDWVSKDEKAQTTISLSVSDDQIVAGRPATFPATGALPWCRWWACHWWAFLLGGGPYICPAYSLSLWCVRATTMTTQFYNDNKRILQYKGLGEKGNATLKCLIYQKRGGVQSLTRSTILREVCNH